MKLGTAGATLDIDVRHAEIAARSATGLGDGDAARVVATALVGGVEKCDALRGRRVRRIADLVAVRARSTVIIVEPA